MAETVGQMSHVYSRPQSIGQAIREARGKDRSWVVAQTLKIDPDNLRALEEGRRPLRGLAEKMLEHYGIERGPLAVSLSEELAQELASVPVNDRLFLIDSFLLATRRYQKTGRIPRVRQEEPLITKAVAKAPETATTVRKILQVIRGHKRGAS